MENAPPQAKSDRFGAAPGALLSINSPGLLRNDSDPDKEELTVSTTPVQGVSNGRLTLNADGSFEYTSDQGFMGEDQFTYEVTDSTGETAQATVTITVQDVKYAKEIEPTFGSSCGGGRCHIDQRTSGVRLSSKRAVLNSEGKGYGRPIVEPGKADRSASPLVDKILPDPRVPPRMPLNQPPLNEGQIAEIRAWIEGLNPDK